MEVHHQERIQYRKCDQLAASGCCLATSNPDFDLPNSCYRPMCRTLQAFLTAARLRRAAVIGVGLP